MVLETRIVAVVGAFLLIAFLVWFNRYLARRYLSPVIEDELFGFDDDE